MSGFTPHNLLTWSGGSVVLGTVTECSGVFIDSRNTMPGGLFVALNGERFDAHDFVGAVAIAGANGAVVNHNKLASVQGQLSSYSKPFFLVAVDDTLVALHGLARGKRLQFSGPVVAVTGSNGKTTTREMLASCLGTQVPVLATQKNYNNEIGLPLTLLGLQAHHGACVVELAMRGLGQIAQLAATALPDIGVITNVGPVHLETLGSIENVALAKSELVRNLSSQGIAILNADDPHVAAMQAATPGTVYTYGFAPGAKVQARNVQRNAQTSQFELWLDGKQVGPVTVALPGSHNVSNALAALCATHAAGFRLEPAMHALGQLAPTSMRLEFVKLANGVTMINDAYNASPLSMRAALEVLAGVEAKRKVAVLGDMLELGREHETQHKYVGKLAAEAGIQMLVTVGEGGLLIAAGAQQAGLPASACVSYANATEAAAQAGNWVKADNCILVKASRGIHLEQVAEAIAALLGRTEG